MTTTTDELTLDFLARCTALLCLARRCAAMLGWSLPVLREKRPAFLFFFLRFLALLTRLGSYDCFTDRCGEGREFEAGEGLRFTHSGVGLGAEIGGVRHLP